MPMMPLRLYVLDQKLISGKKKKNCIIIFVYDIFHLVGYATF